MKKIIILIALSISLGVFSQGYKKPLINANTLDSLSKTDFVRSTGNINETITGNKTYSGTVAVLSDLGLVGDFNFSTGGDIQNAGKIGVQILKLRTSYTFSTLPTASIGEITYITDASSVTYRGIASGGGSDFALVVYNGTNWIYH